MANSELRSLNSVEYLQGEGLNSELWTLNSELSWVSPGRRSELWTVNSELWTLKLKFPVDYYWRCWHLIFLSCPYAELHHDLGAHNVHRIALCIGCTYAELHALWGTLWTLNSDLWTLNSVEHLQAEGLHSELWTLNSELWSWNSQYITTEDVDNLYF